MSTMQKQFWYDLCYFFQWYAEAVPSETKIWCTLMTEPYTIANGNQVMVVRFSPPADVRWTDKAYELMRIRPNNDGTVDALVMYV